MKSDEETSTQPAYDQPVAYDAEGRPLYAHPPSQLKTATSAQSANSLAAPIARAIDPVRIEISNETKNRHERAVRLYPMLNLSGHEYVISVVRRHPIGLFIPVLFSILLITAALTVLFNYGSIVELLSIQGKFADASAVTIPVLLFCVIIGIGMFIVYYVYTNNKFFLTNECVIQEIQLSLFDHREQTISLGNIEDASYSQEGLLQQVFNYGSIRLSTQGDETTYRFIYVANPKQRIGTLNNAVEDFKNDRPVES